MNHARKEELMKQYPKGSRIKLVYMDDKFAPPVGTLGTVTGVDDICSIQVSWDTGSTLSVLDQIDRIEKI